MLSELRKQSRSAIIYVLFGIIIAAFILTFNTMGPTKGCGGQTEVSMADVAGTGIDSGVFGMANFFSLDPPEPGRFGQRAIQAQQSYESTRFVRSNPDFGLMVGFMPDRDAISPFKYRRVMDDLIETWLVSSIAEDLGMDVPDDELAQRVYQNPWLKDRWYNADGQFLKRRFYEFVQYSLGTTATSYEDFIRREMLRERMIVFLSQQVKVSDAEVERQWKLENDQVDLEFVEFRPERLRPIIEVGAADVAKAVAERGDDIAKYYEENKTDYVKEERAQVHGIFVRAPLTATIEGADKAEKEKLTAERAAAEAKAEAIRAELTTDTAKAEEPAAADPKLAALKAKAIPIKPGDVVTAGTGDAAPPATEEAPAAPAVDPAAEALATFEKIASEKSEFIQNKHAGGAFDKPKTRAALASWPFGAGIDEAVFALKPGEVTKVLEVANGYWILRLDKKLPAEERTLETVKAEIARILLLQEREEETAKGLAEAFAATAKAAADKELAAHVSDWLAINLKEAKADEETVLEARRTGPFAMVSEDPESPWGQVALIGHDEKLAKAAFALTPEAPVAEGAFEIEKGGVKRWYVVRLAERIAPNADTADEDKKAIRQRLQATKQRHHYRAWYENVLAKARAEGDVSESDEFLALVESQKHAYEEAIKRWQERMQKKMGSAAPQQ